MPNLAELNLAATLPALSVALWACVLLLADLFVPVTRANTVQFDLDYKFAC